MINISSSWKYRGFRYECFYTGSLLCVLPQNTKCWLGNYIKQRARPSIEELNSFYHFIQRSNSFLKRHFFKSDYFLDPTPLSGQALNLDQGGSCSLNSSLADGLLVPVLSSLLWVLQVFLHFSFFTSNGEYVLSKGKIYDVKFSRNVVILKCKAPWKAFFGEEKKFHFMMFMLEWKIMDEVTWDSC